MKIWLDILTPKQLLFFKPLAAELKARGHNVIATSRHYREVEGLAPLIGFEPEYVGEHGGAGLREKLEASLKRCNLLAKRISEERVDCSLSFSSPECARVSFGLGIRHVCVNDSPHAESVARLTIPLATTLLTPWIIPKREWTKYGVEASNIITYRALDPAAWLKHPFQHKPAPPDLPSDRGRKIVTVRLEESAAAYLLGAVKQNLKEMVRELARRQPECDLVVLCRYRDQVKEFSEGLPNNVITPRRPVDGVALLRSTNVFMGMGGTMTAEAALLGVPTVSAFNPKVRIIVLDWLERKGLITVVRGPEEAIFEVERCLEDISLQEETARKAKRILTWMEDPVQRIVNVVEELGSKKT